MRAYIHCKNGIPADDWIFTAHLGFSLRGTEIVYFEDINRVPLYRSNIVVTNIDNTKRFLLTMAIKPPTPLNIPDELQSFTHRKTSVMSLKTFKETSDVPIFVKPLHKSQLFPAGVITKRSSFIDLFYGITDETQVLTSEVLDIVVEYRGFVIERKLESLNLYRGDFRYYPDVSIIEDAIKQYKSQPAGYTIDFGVTADGKTVLIECNDGWSIGSYGCDPEIYSKLLLRRWIEITKFY